jgi:hypothetical protein
MVNKILKFYRFSGLLIGCLFLFILIFSCSGDRTGKGYNLKKDKLVEMILDHQIAKAAAYKYPVELRDSISEVYYSQLYTIHGVDQFTFEQDIKRLENDPDYYKEIYDEVHKKIQSINPFNE